MTPPFCTVVTTTADSGPGSLRDALACAVDGDTIDATGITGTITLTSGQLLIDTSVTIAGPGANNLSVDGNFPVTTNRVFRTGSGKIITITGLTITNGNEGSTAYGGGIFNNRSTLTVSNCAVVGNFASQGGAFYNDAGTGSATLRIVNSTLTGNSAGSAVIYNNGAFGSATLQIANSTLSSNSAGAIILYNDGFSGTATVQVANSTLSGNSAGTSAAIYNYNSGEEGRATLRIVNSTLSGNSASAASILNVKGTFLPNNGVAMVEIGSTILDSGTSGKKILNSRGTVTSLGYNLSSTNDNTYLNQSTDQNSTNPLLGPLQDNGGPTFTHAPLCGSPAIDKGKNLSGSATDQRGAFRTFDNSNIANATGGDGTDIGAVEAPVAAFTVLNTDDSGAGSLRQAILDANANPGTDVIEFDPGVTGTITLTSGELLITDCLFLDGPGATNLAVNGNYPAKTNRVFRVGPGIDVTIASLTITNGFHDDVEPGGGGILNDHATLTVSDCTISGNTGGHGGGIHNYGRSAPSATLTVIRSTISGNRAHIYGGGGIYNDGFDNGSATLSVRQSTLSGNSANDHGGGIRSEGGFDGFAMASVVASTISGNSAKFTGSGIQNDGRRNGSAMLEIGSTILDAGGGTGLNLFNDNGSVISSGYNLSSDGTGPNNGTTDQISTPPLLGPLQLNGGQTPTHALLCGSPAIDAGTNLTSSATDQRGIGFPRTFGTATDIGAFELQQVCNQAPVALCTDVMVSADSNCVANASIDNGSYDPDTGDMITLTQNPAGPYPLGDTLVTLTVVDSHNVTNTCTGTVTVEDITLPVANCPGNIVKTNDAGQCSAVVTFSVSASDNCTASPTVTAAPASGSTFAVGTTNVVVTAVDDSGNTNTCSFSVTVVDGEAPRVMCRPAPNASGKKPVPGKNGNDSVNPDGYYQVLARDNCDANPLIYIKDTASSTVAGPFHDGDVVRLKHAGGKAAAQDGLVVAIIELRGDGLAVATDAGGNTTADANGCLMVVRNNSK